MRQVPRQFYRQEERQGLFTLKFVALKAIALTSVLMVTLFSQTLVA